MSSTKSAKKRQQDAEKKANELMSNPYIKSVVNELVQSIVQKAIQLPLSHWLEEAEKNGFSGVIWFQFERVHPDDLQELLVAAQEVQDFLGPNHILALGSTRDMILVHRKGDVDTSTYLNIVPIVRALLTPY